MTHHRSRLSGAFLTGQALKKTLAITFIERSWK
jgi:hypothetical protein